LPPRCSWSTFPDSFTVVEPTDFEGRRAIDFAIPLTFAQVWLHLRDSDRAKEFTRIGLAQAPEQATLLRRDYQRILVAA